jgi:hypothetical protein
METINIKTGLQAMADSIVAKAQKELNVLTLHSSRLRVIQEMNCELAEVQKLAKLQIKMPVNTLDLTPVLEG